MNHPIVCFAAGVVFGISIYKIYEGMTILSLKESRKIRGWLRKLG